MATKKKTEIQKKEKAKEKAREKVREEHPYVKTSFGDIDSKFRFVHLASKRAKSLLKGAKPKAKSKSKSPIRLAQIEVREGLIDYRILPSKIEDLPEKEERGFVGGDGVGVSEAELEGEEIPDTAELEEAGAEEEAEEELEEESPEGFEEEKEGD